MQMKQRSARKVFYVTGVAFLCAAAFWLGVYYRDRSIKTGEAAAQDNYSAADENSTEAPAQAPASEDAITYSNTQYGFDIKLPASWDGYTIQSSKWQGTAITGKHQGDVVETGDVISIRHPDWTEENPRQDIPIMVYTLDQWNMVDEEMAVSAAPIPPMELGRNLRYVFALPARYNYAFPAGFEEVEDIMEIHPLAANENFDK